MKYENDGTGTREIKARIKVQSAVGLEKIGQLIFDYNSANERLDIVKVQVTKPDGKIVVTGADSVQDLSSPVAQQAPVYSDARQKHVTVTDLSVGDTLEYDVLNTTFKPLTPGQFWQSWKFINDAPCLDEQVELNVPIGRALKMKNPPDVTPTTRTEGDRQIYLWKTTTEHAADLAIPLPDTANAFNPTALLMGAKQVPYRKASFTTFENWNQVGSWYAQLEQDRRAPTAELKAQADEITKDAKTDLAKAQALYQYVTKNIRYVSLSFGVGRYQPHFAAEVLANKYGDCKDKATLLDALFAAEGLRGSTALINSKVEIDPDVPAPSQFDHAITFVTLNGQDLWLDSTAQVGPFEYLLPQLRNKDALVVLSSQQSELRKTPEKLPYPKYYRLDLDGSITDKKVDVRLGFESRGDLEVLSRAALVAFPPAKLSQLMTAGAKQANPDGDATITDLKAGDPFDTTNPFRIELHVSGDLKKSSKASSTSSSGAIFSDYDVESFLKPVLPEMPLPHEKLTLPGPEQFVLKVKMAAPDEKNLPTFQPAHIVKDFAEFDAQGSSDGHILSIEATLNIKASEIPSGRMIEYGEFRKDVVAKLVHFVKVIKPTSSTSAASAASTAASATSNSSAPVSPNDEEAARQLYASGLKAYNAGNYHGAAELLETATARDPHNSSAFNDLGRAYLAMNQLPQAVTALRKAIDANPDDPYAYNNLGLALMRQKKFDEAVSAFQKQLELNPDDRFVHPNLATLYLQTKEYEKAAAEYEIASKAAPDNAFLISNLGYAYAQSKQPEKALAAFDRALELSPGPAMQNTVAYQLAELNVHLDHAEELVKSAIAATSAQTNQVDLSDLSHADTARMCELATYWDTLGWIKFQQSDLPQAEKYVAAAWGLCAYPQFGDHLGQIYDKQARKPEAIAQYEWTLEKSKTAEETRARLAALLPPKTDLDAKIKADEDRRFQLEGIKFRNPDRIDDNGEVWLLLKPGPRADATRFIAGGDAIKKTAATVQALNFPNTFPDATPITLLRLAWVTCSSYTHECRLGLISAHESAAAVK